MSPDPIQVLPTPSLLDELLRVTGAIAVACFCVALHFAASEPRRIGLGGSR
ncbi:hypothetical protein [Coralloluteibacterium thermophilus]|uniref:Uncharacterized protein n=1 Tax=Coralloluteibacterium thermophilum TaxID=2707049 RepID=A0ABV9NFW2_9GAMM